MAFTLPSTYKEGMEEMVKWANGLPEAVSHRFMLDMYKIYIDWKYLFDTTPGEIDDNINE